MLIVTTTFSASAGPSFISLTRGCTRSPASACPFLVATVGSKTHALRLVNVRAGTTTGNVNRNRHGPPTSAVTSTITVTSRDGDSGVILITGPVLFRASPAGQVACVTTPSVMVSLGSSLLNVTVTFVASSGPALSSLTRG